MRKLAALLLGIFITLQGWAAAAVVVSTDTGAALLTRDGAEIIALGVYDELLNLNDECLAARIDDRWTLLDAGGTRLTEASYDAIRMKNGTILMESEDLLGVLEANGEERFPAAYLQITPARDGCWLLRPNGGLLKDGKRIEEELHASWIGESADGGFLAYRDARNGRFGFLDMDGNIAVKPELDYADRFVCGAAAVTFGGARGLIDATGDWILPAAYDLLEVSEAGFALAWKRGEGTFVFDLNGEEIASYIGENSAATIGDGWMIRDAEALRVYDTTGALRTELPADASIVSGLDGALIVSEGAWGESCVHFSDHAELFQNLFPLGYAHGMPIYGYITAPTAQYMNELLGETQISTDMDAARFGVTDARGNPLTECVYLALEYLADDRLLARTDYEWQMIDAHGNVIWSAEASD